jgi:hypothetical protein
MIYNEIEIDNGYGEIKKHIILDKGNNEFTSFPSEESNPNYQAYLQWLDEGNTPLPADE